MKWEREEMGKRTKEEEAKAEEANGEQRRKKLGKVDEATGSQRLDTLKS